MQQYTREKFRAYADRHGWPTIQIPNVSQDHDVAHIVDRICEAVKPAMAASSSRRS
jgi:hypothetical protein